MERDGPDMLKRWLRTALWVALAGLLFACASGPVRQSAPQQQGPVPGPLPRPAPSALVRPSTEVLAAPIVQAKSRWIAVPWTDLPGFEQDALHEAWNAWLQSCERPGPVFAPLCGEVRRLTISDAAEQRTWMMARLQPYRVEDLSGAAQGLLTAYFEPLLEASRTPSAQYSVPLYRPPTGLAQRKPWYSRQEADTLVAAQAALRGREIAFLEDPVDALILQIQGSGRLRVKQADGSQVLLRLSYAGSNDHAYKSVARWLLDQALVPDGSWASVKNWARRNPDRVNEMLWNNPRLVFFRDEPLSGSAASAGPKGAQGVALTPGRSIAVDPGSVPYGTPVWLDSAGPSAFLQKLVLAQDSGNAIVGGVRADYFVGSGDSAAELAGRLKQNLRMWVLWPRSP